MRRAVVQTPLGLPQTRWRPVGCGSAGRVGGKPPLPPDIAAAIGARRRFRKEPSRSSPSVSSNGEVSQRGLPSCEWAGSNLDLVSVRPIGEIVEDRALDEDRMDGPTETGEQFVDGLAPIEHPDGMAAFALTESGTVIGVMIETASSTRATPVVDIGHVDHLRAPVHHPLPTRGRRVGGRVGG